MTVGEAVLLPTAETSEIKLLADRQVGIGGQAAAQRDACRSISPSYCSDGMSVILFFRDRTTIHNTGNLDAMHGGSGM